MTYCMHHFMHDRWDVITAFSEGDFLSDALSIMLSHL